MVGLKNLELGKLCLFGVTLSLVLLSASAGTLKNQTSSVLGKSPKDLGDPCRYNGECSGTENCFAYFCLPSTQPRCYDDSYCDAGLACFIQGDGEAINRGVCIPARLMCSSNSDCSSTAVCFADICIPKDVTCSSNSECRSYEYCLIITDIVDFGVCTPKTCRVDSDCGVNNECVQGNCRTKVPECSSNSDCATNEQCSGGACVPNVPECSSDSDCPVNEGCFLGVCLPKDNECSYDSECAYDERCYLGSCIPKGSGTCSSDSDCASDEECWNGVCLDKDLKDDVGLAMGIIIALAVGIPVLIIVGICLCCCCCSGCLINKCLKKDKDKPTPIFVPQQNLAYVHPVQQGQGAPQAGQQQGHPQTHGGHPQR